MLRLPEGIWIVSGKQPWPGTVCLQVTSPDDIATPPTFNMTPMTPNKLVPEDSFPIGSIGSKFSTVFGFHDVPC